MSDYPLVSAMMLTGTPGRDPEFAYAAMRCFSDQTWPNKELVILNCGKEPLLTDEKPELDDLAQAAVRLAQ